MQVGGHHRQLGSVEVKTGRSQGTWRGGRPGFVGFTGASTGASTGAFTANPPTYVLEDGGRKTIDTLRVNFKAQVDPYGLLNPGKMRGWLER